MRVRRLIFLVTALACLACGRRAVVVEPPVIEDQWSCFNGRSIFLQEGKYGLLADDGRVILPPEYDAIEFLDDDTALLSQEGSYFLCDRSGRKLSPAAGADSLRLHYEAIAAGVKEADRLAWEKLIQDYGRLCKEGKAARGKRLSRQEFARLQALSRQVRESLSAAGGAPTPSQKARLEELSNDYRRTF